MTRFVGYNGRSLLGWPWPEESLGLAAMYGDGGWCSECYTPTREQVGPLTLQRRGLGHMPPAWVPHGVHELCLRGDLAERLVAEFGIEVRPLGSPRGGQLDAVQVVSWVTPQRWFDDEELTEVLTARHSWAGRECATCGKWKWSPEWIDGLPKPRLEEAWLCHPVIASPEWFGDGGGFRQVMFRLDLAKAIVEANPRRFEILDVLAPSE